MKTIIERPVLAGIFFVIIILFGYYSFQNMPIELVPDPEQGLPSLNISYTWYGASPDMVLKRVLIPAEAEVMQIKGVEKMESRALLGSGQIQVEFNRSVRMNFAEVQLRERLNRLRRDLPPQVIGPKVESRIPEQFDQEPLFRIGIYGKNYSVYTLRRVAENEVLPFLKSIAGIESAEVHGGVDPEIKIQTDIDRLKLFEVDILDIQRRLGDNFYTRQSVYFSRHSGEVSLSLSENPEAIDEIRNIPLKNLGEKKIRLKDVADVFLGYEELRNERRFQGRSFVQFELYKEPNYSHLEVAASVREKLQYLADRMRGRVEFVIQSDDSLELKRQLMKLAKIALLILVIIFVILYIIIRDIRSSLLIFSSVFFSVFATLTVVYLFDIALNLLTLSGLALGFGLFVDNAVVVFDSILRFREHGRGLKESAVEGARAVIMPVLASTFTTIIVFFSFALLFQDRLRVYYLPLAYIIAISLLSSIVVSFVLIPSLSARINIRLNTLEKQKQGGHALPLMIRFPRLLVILPILILSAASVLLMLDSTSLYLTANILLIALACPLIIAHILMPRKSHPADAPGRGMTVLFAGITLVSGLYLLIQGRLDTGYLTPVLEISIYSSLVIFLCLVPTLRRELRERFGEEAAKQRQKPGKWRKIPGLLLRYPLMVTITALTMLLLMYIYIARAEVSYGTSAYILLLGLFTSVVVCFALCPAPGRELRARLKRIKENRSEHLFSRGRFFPFILKYPLIILLPIILMAGYSYHLFKEEVSFGRFFSWYSQERIVVRLIFRTGTEFGEVQDAIMGFEKAALEKDYEKEINTTVMGRYAYMTIKFPKKIEKTSLPLQLKQELVGHATNLAGVGVLVSGFDQEPYYYNPDTGTNLPYSIEISGYNFEKLMDFAGKIRTNLLSHRRIKEAEIQTDMKFWWGARDKYYSLILDREKLKSYRIPPRYLLYLIGTVVRERARAQRLKYNERELYVEIKASDVDELELDDILDKYLLIPGGVRFRVRDVVNVEFKTQRGGITRQDQEYKAMIQWDYLGSARAGDRFHTAMYEKLQVPVGFSKSLEERRFELSAEEKDQLNWAILLSLGLIYLVLGMLYENYLQPFLIMLSIPLALIGVFFAFVWFEYSFDSTAYIGVILLFGIVVNNAILLIDNINRHLQETGRIIEAIAVGTKERIRPIFMTSLTTVLGMLPMVIFRDAASKGDIWSSLALCTVGGLTTSALLILFVLPIFYYLFYRFGRHLAGKH